MNETTLFLAQIMGPTFAVMGLAMLLHRDYYNEVFKKSMEPNLAYLMTTMAMIVIGVVLVTKHFLWGSLAEIIISFISLAILIKAVCLALVPTALNDFIKKFMIPKLLNFGSIIWIVGGLYLIFVGYFA